MRDVIDDIKEAFLTGVSYMLPFVVAGGILVALGFLLGGYNIPSVEPYGSTFASTIFWIGKIGLGTFMVPVLGAYVAYSIADKPGICVGMFGGWMATDPWGLGYQSGFIGALIAGIIAGYLVNAFKENSITKCNKIITSYIDHSSCRMCSYLFINALCYWRTFRSINTGINKIIK